ncbi:tRNA uridine-5-carboxymethylaminomethyl(34) synthesis GTPase MnmE [Fodinicurvata fenggangensis]|uniref:tRNA uridine-5-carboxymethylaminomethyl(34) synthesis GTPase MnmE n=1 Tax=Fodinicurvata fenggangensis TaxID=1121830 RepID=UPI00047E0473|nr:tRNA uridine-5-carboxymethylaminomethyl(34) synthesis GTPase MnmE [Fodinicurvata fenggangensis]
MNSACPDSTVYALSSGRGRSAVAVVRLSGPACGAVLDRLCGTRPPAREARVRSIRDPISGELLDRALVLWFPGPGSFTGEDSAELHLHGSQAVVSAVLRVLSGFEGVQAAGPGDFTRRAFDNEKLDLSEVEGLADLIDAQTDVQRRQAQRQFDGALSDQVESWRHRLIRLAAHMEATIDFSDEEIPNGLLERSLLGIKELREELQDFLATSHVGERIRQGFQVTLLGAPNAGKSSLLNKLARREAAIVSDMAGTTRDVIEVAMDIAGFPVILSDTAGLRQDGSADAIEAEGMRRSQMRAEEADLKLVLFDGLEIAQPDRGGLGLLDDKAIAVITKRDVMRQDPPASFKGHKAYHLSAKTGEGLEKLLEAIQEQLTRLHAETDEAPVLLTRQRHRESLEDCAAALERAESAPDISLMAEDIRHALSTLGRITGRVDVEDLLDVIFRDFCIGK